MYVLNKLFDMKIFDDFLPRREFNSLQEFIMGGEIDWYLQPWIADTNDNPSPSSINFTHLFYGNDQPVDVQGLNMLVPLIDRLNSISLIRLKANAYPNTSDIVEHPYHTDSDYKHQTCLFYINSNDGYTKFDDTIDFPIKKIKSKENRLVFFDSSLPHASTSCTDTRIRYNININYFSETEPTPYTF